MNSVFKSNVSRTMVALGVVGVLLAAVAPAAAHKSGNHSKHNKPPQNQGPIGPLPKPQPPISDTGWHAAPRPVVVRDHRGGGSTVTVTDSKTRPRGGVQCLGNMCGVGKTAKRTVGSVIKTIKNVIPH